MADARHYRPACTVRMQIRLEDFQADADEATTPTELQPFEQQLVNLRAKLQKQRGVVASARATGTKENVRRELATQRNIEAQIAKLETQKPQGKATSEQVGDVFSVSFITMPYEMSCELNSFRSTDTCRVVIPFKDAPLESQNIRSALLEVFLGTVPAEDFATPGRWKLNLDKRRPIFRGYVDDWKTKHDDEDATVEVDARSLESILVDAKVDPRSKIFRVQKGGEAISAFVNRVLANVPATSGRTGGDQLKARFFRATNEPLLDSKALNRVLQTASSRNAANPAQAGVLPDDGQTGTTTGGVAPTGELRMPPAHPQEMTAWEVIVQACGLVGCIPVYDPSLDARDFTKGSGSNLNPFAAPGANLLNPISEDPQALASDFLLIRPAETIYETVKQGVQVVGGAPDHFERFLPDVNSPNKLVKSQIRFLVWGRNIRSISTTRKLGRVKVPTIEVISYNPDAPPAERVVRAVFPPDKKVVTRRGAKGEAPTNEVLRKYVFGIRSKEQLLNVAKGIYHVVGRNELCVDIETDDMSSYIDPSTPETNNENPDVLDMRSGTPVRVLVARQVIEADGREITISPLSEVFERRTGELRKFLLEQQSRFNPQLDEQTRANTVDQMVAKIAATIDAAKRNDLFYVRTIRHQWNSDDGWSAAMNLVNFIEARNLPKNISSTTAKEDDKRRLKIVLKDPVVIAVTRVKKSQGGN